MCIRDRPNIVEIMKLRNYQKIEDNFENVVKNSNRSIALSIVNERLAKIAIKNPSLYTFASISWAQNEKTNLDTLDLNILIPNNKSHNQAIIAVENEVRNALEFGFTDAEIQEKIDDLNLLTSRTLDAEKSRFNSSIASKILNDFSNYQVTQNANANKELTLKIIPLIKAKTAHEELVKLWGQEEPQFFVVQNEKVEGIENIIKTSWLDAGKIKLLSLIHI